jgi:hypothetical protein
MRAAGTISGVAGELGGVARELGTLGRELGGIARELGTLGRRLGIVATVVPRTIVGWSQAACRPVGSLPPPAHRTVRQVGEVGVDECFLAVNALVRQIPDHESLRAMVDDSARLASALGGIDPPELHPAPILPLNPDVRRARVLGMRVERVSYASECTLPGVLRRRAPWLDAPGCVTAQAVVMRHLGAPRPWVICVHGAGQGRATDLIAFRAAHLHRKLGLNVVLPVLPLHGRRLVRGVQMPGFDLPSNAVAVLQGVHDIRRLITWIRQQDPSHVAVYGVSLGGHTASILAGVEPAVDTVIAGVPVTGLARLLTYHLDRFSGSRRHPLSALMGSEPVIALDRLISPLALPPLIPRERRFIFAGLGDAITTPHHAVDLWEHWERPTLDWYPGGHVGHVWSRRVHAFVDDVLGHLRPAEGPSSAPRAERAA